jgi:hypothetical protein
MKKYRCEKTTRITRMLDTITTHNSENETLRQVASIIRDKAEFYDGCLASWDNPSEIFGEDDVRLGRKCSEAGLNMADAIVNELRILYAAGA